MSDTTQQIPLTFKTTKVKTFQDFVLGKNVALIESLNSFSQSEEESLLYIWGESGSGKSHVVEAFINLLHTNSKTAVLLTPKDLKDRQKVSLIEMFDYICIDDTHEIAKNTILEESLFFWINEVKQVKKKIVLSGQISNKNQQWELPDLRSRLQSGRTHELIALGRNEVLTVFKKLSGQQGIMIDSRVEAFIEKNCPMNLSFLSALLNKLDEITLVEKKQVTIPLLKKILESKLVK